MTPTLEFLQSTCPYQCQFCGSFNSDWADPLRGGTSRVRGGMHLHGGLFFLNFFLGLFQNFSKQETLRLFFSELCKKNKKPLGKIRPKSRLS